LIIVFLLFIAGRLTLSRCRVGRPLTLVSPDIQQLLSNRVFRGKAILNICLEECLIRIEAAKLAPRECHELAMVRERELEKGNPNRATLAVARKMVSYLLAVERRKQDFVPAEEFKCTAAA
jgi:hypothetical protein